MLVLHFEPAEPGCGWWYSGRVRWQWWCWLVLVLGGVLPLQFPTFGSGFRGAVVMLDAFHSLILGLVEPPPGYPPPLIDSISLDSPKNASNSAEALALQSFVLSEWAPVCSRWANG